MIASTESKIVYPFYTAAPSQGTRKDRGGYERPNRWFAVGQRTISGSDVFTVFDLVERRVSHDFDYDHHYFVFILPRFLSYYFHYNNVSAASDSNNVPIFTYSIHDSMAEDIVTLTFQVWLLLLSFVTVRSIFHIP